MRRALLLVSIFTAACGSDSESTPPGPAPVEALYGVASETALTPYPSDRYTTPDPATATGRRVHIGADTTADPSIALFASTIDELDEMDGFSTSGGVIVSFSGPIDIRGIAADTDPDADPAKATPPRDAAELARPDSPLVLIDVDPTSPERGTLRGLVARWWAQPKDDYYPTDDFTLVAQPAVPLRPATRYLFAVTRQLRAQSGGDVARSPAMNALLTGTPGDAYAEEVQAGLTDLESAGVARSEVVLATAFTTATIHADMIAMAKAAREAPSPALASDWEVETPQETDGRVRFRAVFEAPEYRKPKPDGKWVIDSAGPPVAQSTAGLEVFLAFADATKAGPRPVVIYGHGLGGTKDGCWGTAGRLVDINAAVFSIDSPEHGSRSDSPDNPVAATFSFFGIDSNDSSFDIGRARDNFRQMGSDQLELVRFIGSLGSLDLLPVGAPDGVPDLDVSRILYIGHSFGSVQGPLVFALAPEIEQAVWNVGGDGLMTLLRDSGTFSVLVNGMRPPHTTDGALGRFFAMTQAIVDPGDPLNYARFGTQEAFPGVPAWSARDVLLQEVIADSIVPNSTSEALARAAGLELVDPIAPISGIAGKKGPLTSNLPGGSTGAIAQFDMIEGGKTATHGELIFSPEAQAQYVEFFRSGLTAPHATVISAYGP